MKLFYYKTGQGNIIRWVSLVLTLLIVFFACYSLYSFKELLPPTSGTPQQTLGYKVRAFWNSDIVRVPFFDFLITNGLVICVFLFLILGLIGRLILNKPKAVDFLIDTEIELKKVSWPPRYQYFGSSSAVVISIIIIGLFLLFFDTIFDQLRRLFIW